METQGRASALVGPALTGCIHGFAADARHFPAHARMN